MDHLKLIELVHALNAPWDQLSNEYSSMHKNEKAVIWDKIGTQMGSNSIEVKKLWECLRDGFCHELKKIPKSRSGSVTNNYVVKWAYFKSVLFLKPSVVPKDTSEGSNLNLISVKEMDINEFEDTSNEQIIEVPSSDVSLTHYGLNTPSCNCNGLFGSRDSMKRKSNNLKLLDVEEKRLQLFSKRLEQKEEEMKICMDPDMLFLQSLLLYMKKTKNDLKFKMEIMKFIFNFLQDEDFDNDYL